jgi:hypothetical protein
VKQSNRFVTVMTVVGLALSGCALPYADLPDIHQFQSNPSDQFLVDVSTINAGHPFKGRRAVTPHQGAHVHWDNSSNAWPQGGSAPNNYPAIYAVADGYVDRIDYKFPVGANDRYGIDLAIAKDGSSVYLFCYSIEPMVPEPSTDFYKSFILAAKGQKVRKGDIIAYMYLPPGAGIGCHIHFHLQQKDRNNFLAPAIFTGSVVDAFHDRWNSFGFDGATPIPSCMGYMLDADENPYADAAVDILK